MTQTAPDPTASPATLATSPVASGDSTPVRLAVAGAGLIGKAHLAAIAADPDALLVALADPAPAATELAEQLGVPVFASVAELVANQELDAVIVATPNLSHRDDALAVIAAGIPVLVEKPLATDSRAAAEIVAAARAAGVPLLTGHHRNHSSIMAAARSVIASGTLGRLVAVQGTACFFKPDGYFDVGGGWRRSLGGGPMQLNLIHEVDDLQQLLGPITQVQAMTSNQTRGFEVEDTAAIVLQFASGALGTFLLSDTAASPLSWEQTAAENPVYDHHHDENCYVVIGTDGSLAVPTMRISRFTGERSWTEPLQTEQETDPRDHAVDPIAAQIAHLVRVVRGQQEPLCGGAEGLAAVAVVEAVLEAASSGRSVPVKTVEELTC